MCAAPAAGREEGGAARHDDARTDAVDSRSWWSPTHLPILYAVLVAGATRTEGGIGGWEGSAADAGRKRPQVGQHAGEGVEQAVDVRVRRRPADRQAQA